MADKIKFKVSIKELAFEFEGTREVGQALQAGLTNSIGNILKTQQTVMALDPPPSEPTVFDLPPPVDDEQNGHSPSPKPRRAKKANGEPTIPACLRDLKANGYFATPRTAQHIQEHLKVAKGHNIKPNSLSGPLQKLTQNNELYRKEFDDILHYQDKPFDESA